MSLVKYDYRVKDEHGLIVYNNIDEEMASYVFVKSLNKFYHPATGTFMSITAYDLEYNGYIPRRGGRASQYAKAELMIESVEDVIYYPRVEPGSVFVLDGVKYVNSMSPESIPDTDPDWIDGEAWQICMTHIRTIFNDSDGKVLLHWMAHNVQKPGKKILWAPIIVGTQGDGKTTLLKIMSAAMGRRNVKHVSPEALDSAFNGYASGSAVVALEEVRVIGKSRHPIMEKLKPLLTNDVVEVVSKGVDGRQVPNTTNYIALTNHADALVLDANDRRWGVFKTKFDNRDELLKELGPEYWSKLHQTIEDNPEQLRGWLLAVDVSGFDPHSAPEITGAKLDMIRESRSSAAENIEMILGTAFGVTEGVILNSALAEALKNYGYRMPEGKALKRALEDLGFKSGGNNKFRGVKTRWYYNPVFFNGEEPNNIDLRVYLEKNDPEIEAPEEKGEPDYDESAFL